MPTPPLVQPQFVLNPLSQEEANALRDSGGAVYVADSHPGYPCRQCLRDAEIGEELILVSHDPFESDSPYRSASPIFVHRADCQEALTNERLPAQLLCRQLSVRSFDEQELMIDAEIIDGRELEKTIDALFADEASRRIHVHNASRGCFAVSIDRPSST